MRRRCFCQRAANHHILNILIYAYNIGKLTTRGKEPIANGGAHKAIEVSLVGAVARIEDLLHALWVVNIEKAIGTHPGDEGCLILVRQIVHILKKC